MKKSILFIGIPLLFNLIFMGLYFSGIESLQFLMAPEVEGIPASSWREFGIMEQSQNIFLLCGVFLFSWATIKRTATLEKVFFGMGTAVLLFLFLEEMDYGIHLIHYFSNTPLETTRFSWHNQKTFSGHENERYLKKIADIAGVICFFILPLLKSRITSHAIKSIIPSLWFIPLLVISFLVSSMAHFLDDQGLAVINMATGGLKNNISEFRETTTYYIYLMYAFQLVKTVDLKSIQR